MNAFRFSLAAHVLRAMALAQSDERRVDLETLTADVGVRRKDVRETLSALHQEGLVDVTRMRLTLAGFQLGSAFASRRLKPLRSFPEHRVAAA